MPSPDPAQPARQRQFNFIAISRWLREPLLHFLLLGAALFVAWSYFEPGPTPDETATEIRLTPDDVLAMWSFFNSQWQRAPTPEEFSRMVENKVREEVLYREAIAMGLDKDDTIVKRRMAQKMQFLAEDVAAAYEPDDAELEAWYAANADKFALPGRISFRQLYFSPDQRGQQAHSDAQAALDTLAGQAVDTEQAASLGDAFMLQDYYADRTPEQVAKEFGPVFAQAVFLAETGSWQGPIESGFGWHLVFVDSFIPGRQPAFAEVAPEVKTAWLAQRKTEAWDKAYDEMRARYTVTLPVLPESADAMPALPAAGGDQALQ
ncbi:MAG: peptidyl-prolyl cis-trans isomerase [Halioglobus sp.]|nr:peptidyl-prolyl cis-trans isomerase [Halioglobus sp.]